MTLSLTVLLGYYAKIIITSIAIKLLFPNRKEFKHIYWIWDFILFKNIDSEYIPTPIKFVRKFLIGRIVTSLILAVSCGIPILFILNTLGLFWAGGAWLWNFVRQIGSFLRWLCSSKRLVVLAIIIMCLFK